MTVFRGSVIDGQCRIPYRIPGTSVSGFGMIDTGSSEALAATHLAETLGVQMEPNVTLPVHGLGVANRALPVGVFNIELLPTQGSRLQIRGQMPVAIIKPPIDFLLGTKILAWGIFTLDGTTGTWEWRITRAPLVLPGQPDAPNG